MASPTLLSRTLSVSDPRSYTVQLTAPAGSLLRTPVNPAWTGEPGRSRPEARPQVGNDAYKAADISGTVTTAGEQTRESVFFFGKGDGHVTGPNGFRRSAVHDRRFGMYTTSPDFPQGTYTLSFTAPGRVRIRRETSPLRRPMAPAGCVSRPGEPLSVSPDASDHVVGGRSGRPRTRTVCPMARGRLTAVPVMLCGWNPVGPRPQRGRTGGTRSWPTPAAIPSDTPPKRVRLRPTRSRRMGVDPPEGQ